MGQHNPHREHVPATNLENGLSKCVNFVQNCDAKPVIVGHNILNFDSSFSFAEIRSLTNICRKVASFLDMLGKCLIKKEVGHFKQT